MQPGAGSAQDGVVAGRPLGIDRVRRYDLPMADVPLTPEEEAGLEEALDAMDAEQGMG